MQQYTESKTFKFSKQQMKSLKILESYNVNVSWFVRQAIKEKLNRDWQTIKKKSIKNNCPF